MSTALLLCTSPCLAEFWVTGYYPGWEQDSMPASSIDFSALTHIIHFSAIPNENGTLNITANSLSESNCIDLVSRTHEAGKKAILCIGAGETRTMFLGATSPTNLPVFIKNITNLVAAHSYDGIDIDWEPLWSSDAPQFTRLIEELRAALDSFSQPKLLTIAVAAYPPFGDSPDAHYSMLARLQGKLDQINVMTYDLAGPYGGWVTWFNAALYDGGYTFPSSGKLVTSVNGSFQKLFTNGLSRARLGLGIPFYGYLWTGGRGAGPNGITQPRQSWKKAPSATSIRFATIKERYYQSNLYHWDTNAQAAYLSITNDNSTDSIFISYDDECSCQAKVNYARRQGLGGVSIWQLAQDRQKGQSSPLLQAIKQALCDCSNRPEVEARRIQQLRSTLPLFTNMSPGIRPSRSPAPSNGTNEPPRFYNIQTPPMADKNPVGLK